ncbi:glycoside hydrolase family 2 protein [Thermopolyspora sp. NPDC052614]|uniref:glycosyl hydrolase 2 galactose-binding domain-containing protein n=1 Tax=Thermopolyspora sp. NPDC052614 TaxID=3155682 RepID=UPI003448B6B1
MSYRPLHHSWTLRPVTEAHTPAPTQAPAEASTQAPTEAPAEVPVAGPIPASVPGCVHTDLLAAGLIPDPYLDDNETRLGWIGRTDWAYETVFGWEDTGDERVDLVCDGLDTVAEIELNGTLVGTGQNMHRRHRFDVSGALRPGENRLTVRFAAPYAYAERWRDELGERPGPYAEPYQFIRKMACNFGWDWGPTLVTSGIWRPIGLHAWSGARLARVRPFADASGRLRVHADVERLTGDELVLTVAVAGVTASAVLAPDQGSAVVELHVPGARPWWPLGHGEQPLYDLTVTLAAASPGDAPEPHAPEPHAPEPAAPVELDAWRGRIGFRDVTVDTTDGAFTLIVNGEPVFARGVNWIPDDCFPHRVDRARYAERLGQAIDAGVNLVRVWGGGLYESDDFYDVCDERGLLVWQDFTFACAAYPEEGPFAAEVEAEARDNVARLLPHPSLALWCGNNENLEGFSDWHWQERLQGRSWGAAFYYDLLPRIVAEVDPSRPYWPGSPYSGAPDLPPNDPARGTIHIWDVWNHREYGHYRDYRPRFVAEFGFQAPPAYATLRRALSDDPLAPDSPGMIHHQKAVDGNGKLAAGLKPYLPLPGDPRDPENPGIFDDWHYLCQVNQARAISLGVEHLRAQWPHCAGAVVWQLNDCWPVTSWSMIDGDARRKPLWYALRRAFAPRLLTVQPRGDGLALVAINDTPEPWRTAGRAVRHDFGGAVLAERAFELDVPPRGVAEVELAADASGDLAAGSGDPRRELLAVTAGTARCLWFFAPDKDLDLPAPDLAATAEPVEGGIAVTVTARTLLRDLTLFPDRLDSAAEVDEQLVTLLPGERATFLVRTSARLDASALLSRPVLRCVNDVVAAEGPEATAPQDSVQAR